MNRLVKKLIPYILLLPVLLFIVGIFLVGIGLGLLQSLGYFPAIGLKKITFEYYKNILSNPDFLKSLRFSFYTSFISSAVAMFLGILLAYLLVKYNTKKRRGFDNLYSVPIIVPHTIAALLVFILFTQSGWIPRLLYHLNIINNMEDFYPLVFDNKGIGIIMAYVWKGLPFICLISYDVMKNVDEKYTKIAINLGATSFKAFWNIVLPLSLPTIIMGFIILFTFSFGAFEIPYLLGPSNSRALPISAYIYYKSVDLLQQPYAMVINICITCFSLIMVVFYLIVYQLIKKFN